MIISTGKEETERAARTLNGEEKERGAERGARQAERTERREDKVPGMETGPR